MQTNDDHGWNLKESDEGYLPENQQAWDRKYQEWTERNWPEWLAQQLSFPFMAIREEDDDDAYFAEGAAMAPFRLGHKMEVIALAECDVDRGMIVKVREKNQTSSVPLSDLEVTPKTDPNFWPVREYVVWDANRG